MFNECQLKAISNFFLSCSLFFVNFIFWGFSYSICVDKLIKLNNVSNTLNINLFKLLLWSLEIIFVCLVLYKITSPRIGKALDLIIVTIIIFCFYTSLIMSSLSIWKDSKPYFFASTALLSLLMVTFFWQNVVPFWQGLNSGIDRLSAIIGFSTVILAIIAIF